MIWLVMGGAALAVGALLWFLLSPMEPPSDLG